MGFVPTKKLPVFIFAGTGRKQPEPKLQKPREGSYTWNMLITFGMRISGVTTY